MFHWPSQDVLTLDTNGRALLCFYCTVPPGIYICCKIPLSLLLAEQAQLSVPPHSRGAPVPSPWWSSSGLSPGISCTWWPKKGLQVLSAHSSCLCVQVLTVTEGDIYHYGPCIFDGSKWSLEHIHTAHGCVHQHMPAPTTILHSWQAG